MRDSLRNRLAIVTCCLALLVAVGCSKRTTAEPAATQPASGATAEEPAAPPAHTPPAGAWSLRGGSTTPHGSALVPAGEPGDVRVALAGCLRESVRDEASGARHPARRGVRGPQVSVLTLGSGAIITHDLAHACCLTASVEVTVEEKRVVLQETLTGTPCRCMCQSTIRSAVRLDPGQYTLEVRLSAQGADKVVHEGQFVLEKKLKR